jgi:hemolysin D
MTRQAGRGQVNGAAPSAALPVPVKVPMNGRRVPGGPLLRLLPEVQDRAFLPAALEILETPPSPVRMAMLLTICALAAAGLAWSWFGRIDIHASIRAKVEPAGRVKVVQPLEAGKVADIRVANGQAVKAGEVLLVMDRREAEADLGEAAHAATAAQAEALRRQAELAAVRLGGLNTPPAIDWPADIPDATRAREETVLRGDLAELSATLANLDDQAREKQAAVAQLRLAIAAEMTLTQPLSDRIDIRQTLFGEGNGSRLNLLDAEQALLQNNAQVAGDVGKRIEAEEAIATLRSERRHTIDAFLADDLRKMADARRTADEKAQERAKAQARLDRLTLTAPVDGTVQALSVTTPGQVVTTSQELLRIVPLGQPLEIHGYVTNDDIGFVEPGQVAVVKLDAFPFTRYGTIEAEVTHVAHDAVPAQNANQATSDATRPGEDAATPQAPTALPMNDLMFETTLKPTTEAIRINGRDIPLVPGMTATVEIKTGSRRIIEYLFSPLMEVTSRAMGER